MPGHGIIHRGRGKQATSAVQDATLKTRGPPRQSLASVVSPPCTCSPEPSDRATAAVRQIRCNRCTRCSCNLFCSSDTVTVLNTPLFITLSPFEREIISGVDFERGMQASIRVADMTHLLRRRRPRPKRCPGPGARGDPPDGAQCPDGHEQGQPAPDRAEPEAASAERHDADRRGRGATHHERAVVEVARAWLGFGLGLG